MLHLRRCCFQDAFALFGLSLDVDGALHAFVGKFGQRLQCVLDGVVLLLNLLDLLLDLEEVPAPQWFCNWRWLSGPAVNWSQGNRHDLWAVIKCRGSKW